MYHSTDWTLLLKKHKTTILLSVQPDNTTLSAVKEKLFHCLVSRGINEINNDPVPLDVNGIDLGIPIDQNEPEKGWISLERKATGDDDKSEMPNGKPRQLSDTILSAGLSDRNILAFRFRQPGETSSEAHETELDHADPGWDVILPSFDDEDEELPL
ncbi:hypothetical protein N7468_005169 [Penicillium chermesinum]|uniref:Uncharacterized protein n=1 Tax=Penicillium chermesinum TaxID=63820 RepID=A0A9W9P1B4_9EURO|nr:uncharacterized protein N7468_005169 [Penicillium chermesinum]KAJ5232213.1 hypothetical protein N7468_005169 [Penicillium chermesinum]KAJ6171875.1 hypothetical protein N7470_000942 [Penicillium chermesinum]